MKFGHYKVVARPAMFVLVGAILTGATAIPLLKRAPTQNVPAFGYVHPQRWKFETRGGAAATLTPLVAKKAQAEAPTPAAAGPGPADRGVFLCDTESGIVVNVAHPGPSADCVYLRNVINLTDDSQGRKYTLRFEGKSDKAFPVTFTVRDRDRLLWSDSVSVQGGWRNYELPITIGKKPTFENVAVAVHLGAQAGEISLRHVQVKD